jgi:hypothetical protein
MTESISHPVVADNPMKRVLAIFIGGRDVVGLRCLFGGAERQLFVSKAISQRAC